MIDLESVDLATLEATMTTDKGSLVIGFYPAKAPRHVRNFAELAQRGFYDGIAFHRVIRNFMIQGGCPNTREGAAGTPGTGGPGHHIDAEFNDIEHRRGVISMARSQDPNSAGSQFFVVHGDHVQSLDGSYTAFGYVKEGLDVLDSIALVDCEFGPGGERSVPTERIAIQSVTICEVEPQAATADAPAGADAGADADADVEVEVEAGDEA